MDVLLLAREKVLSSSSDASYDNVVFFDREDNVATIKSRLRGAHGFSDDFFELIDLDDAEEPDNAEALQALDQETELPDEVATRNSQRSLSMRRQFIRQFPFDVINLDTERYYFIPSEVPPGKLVNALSQILLWQTHGRTHNGQIYSLQQFDLLFTVRIGPGDLPMEYKKHLIERINVNRAMSAEVNDAFQKRTGGIAIEELFDKNFNEAFRIAIPKNMADIILDSDWHIAKNKGFTILEFERQTANGQNYIMLHLLITLNRNSPVRKKRFPGKKSEVAEKSHIEAVCAHFLTNPINIDKEMTTELEDKLNADLESLIQFRAKRDQELDLS